MIGPELFRLGRALIAIGIEAMPPGGFQELPTSVRIVLVDAFDNPGTTIGAIAERTGFPQSHVSAAVARLRDEGVLATERDEADRRRTLVTPAPGVAARAAEARASMPPIDDTITRVLTRRFGPDGAGDVDEVVEALETLGRLLLCAPSPVAAGVGAASGAKPC